MKKLWLLPALLATVSLCGCNFVLTPASLEESSETESQSVVASEIASEETSDGGWEKPVVSSSEELSEKPSENKTENLSYEFDFDAHNPNEWQCAYRDYLKGLNSPDGDVFSVDTYFLADIEDRYSQYDPELCIKVGTCEADYELLIYDYNPDSGKVEELVGEGQIGAGHSTFYVGPDGCLYSYAGHMGYLWATKYSGFADGKVKSEVIFEEDLNQEQKENYTLMSNIIGEEIMPVMTAPVTDDSLLLWYLNIPVSTKANDAEEADAAITAALYENADVYVVGDMYYSGKSGLMPFHDLKKPGVLDSYSDIEYDLNVYCITDANFDGQDEMLIRLASKERNDAGKYNFSHILLSYQDGVVYAYVFPYLTYEDTFLTVCAFDVYHNWYCDEGDYYYGFVFDKDRRNLLYTDNTVEFKPDVPERNIWKTFCVDFGY